MKARMTSRVTVMPKFEGTDESPTKGRRHGTRASAAPKCTARRDTSRAADGPRRRLHLRSIPHRHVRLASRGQCATSTLRALPPFSSWSDVDYRAELPVGPWRRTQGRPERSGRGTVRPQDTCSSCTAREGKPVRIRRWSATVNGAPPRRCHKPGYLKVREFPPSRHKDWGSVRPRWCGVSRVEVRESENRAYPPSHLDECFRSRPGHAVGFCRYDLVRRICRRRRADAAADHGGPGRGPIDRGEQLSANGTIDDVTPGTPDLSTTVQAVIGLGATGIDLPGARAGTVLPQGERWRRTSRRQGSDGPGHYANLILAAHVLGANPVQFRGHQSRGPPAGDGADHWWEPQQVRHRHPGCQLRRRHSRSGVGAGRTGGGGCEGRCRRPNRGSVNQQCTDGGWALPDDVDQPVRSGPIGGAFPDEDTNTTSYAVQG